MYRGSNFYALRAQALNPNGPLLFGPCDKYAEFGSKGAPDFTS